MGHNNLGAVLRHQQKNREAEVEYRKAIELDPSNTAAQNNLRLVLADEK
jgi:Flp pilus assembly protein TadD